MKKYDEKIMCRKQFMIGNRFYFAMTVIMQIFMAVANISIAFLMQITIEAMEYKDVNLFKNALWFLGIILISFLVFGLAQKVFKNKYMKKGLAQYKQYIFEKILKKSVGEVGNVSSGKFINVFSNDLSSIEVNYLNGNIQIIYNSVVFIVAIMSMLYINWTLMVAVILASALPLAVSLKYGRRLMAKEKKTSDENEGFVDQVKDLLNGFLVIKSFKAENEVLHLFKNQNFILEEAKRDRRETNDTMSLASQVSNITVVSVIFIVGIYLVFKGSMTIGGVVAFVNLSNYILLPITQVIPLWSNRKAAIVLIDKIADFVAYRETPEKKEEIKGFESKIELKNVSVAYNGTNKVLNSINLAFEKGKSYAIVGGSGCGKSTLIKLLLGYLPNYEGEVSIDGKGLANISSESLYDVVSVIQQNVFLFNDTIENNITMFKKFSSQKLKQAISYAGLEKLIDEKGNDYQCGEGGHNLSGGEKQRVSIARCLIRETPVLLMDEATSALDHVTAYEIEDEILKINDLTRIIVTHKLEEDILSKYDEIIVLRDGEVVEKGSFAELMSRREYFYSLYNVIKAS